MLNACSAMLIDNIITVRIVQDVCFPYLLSVTSKVVHLINRCCILSQLDLLLGGCLTTSITFFQA